MNQESRTQPQPESEDQYKDALTAGESKIIDDELNLLTEQRIFVEKRLNALLKLKKLAIKK